MSVFSIIGGWEGGCYNIPRPQQRQQHQWWTNLAVIFRMSGYEEEELCEDEPVNQNSRMIE